MTKNFIKDSIDSSIGSAANGGVVVCRLVVNFSRVFRPTGLLLPGSCLSSDFISLFVQLAELIVVIVACAQAAGSLKVHCWLASKVWKKV